MTEQEEEEETESVDTVGAHVRHADRQAAEREEGRKRQHRCPLCVILSSSLTISAFFPPLFLHFVPHQRLPPWQTSSRGCSFDSQCRPPSTTACVPPHALYLWGRRHAQEGFSPVAWPLPILKAKLAIGGGPLCVA